MNEPSGVVNVRLAETVVLCIGSWHEDRAGLERIFHGSGWLLLTADSPAATLSALRERTVSIVICDDDRFPETWRDLLALMAHWDNPPLLIVTARLADERLWAEALNLGAYDVLATPFDVTEAVRVVNMAQRRWHSHREFCGAGKRMVAAANGTPSRME